MTTKPTTERFEGGVQILIMLAIGTMAGAASFTHVHDVATTHGQPDWIGWADATVVELMSIALGLELRRRARTGRPIWFVGIALLFFVLTSLAAQVVEAEFSVIGWLSAALPAIGFLALVKVVLSRTAATTTPSPVPAVTVVEHEDQADEHAGTTPVDITTPADDAEPVPTGVVPAPEVPRHLLPTARFAVVNHEQTTGRRITARELATRMSITPQVAGQLLHTIAEPALSRVNGTPVGGTP